MTQRQILIVTDDSGESYEILYAKHRFEEAGFTPHIAATEKKRLHGVIHDFEPGWNTYIEKPGYLIAADLAISKAQAEDYEALMLIGGRAPEFLRHHKPLLKLVREFDRQEKWLFAICHGIQVLLAAGLGAGKKLTCYENVRFEVTACGGHWSKKQCQVDGRIITAQTWESHPAFYRSIFKHLYARA
ncbi:MAG TPA: DJ-1/PfpI family protein [Verrucomicrobiales bacterium]|nr:DJ-1/PfpI family protein [Verrucomicrobiales bacterium]